MPAFNSVLNESPQERINSTFQFVQTLAGPLNNWEDRSRLVLLGWAGCGWDPVTRMRTTPHPAHQAAGAPRWRWASSCTHRAARCCSRGSASRRRTRCGSPRSSPHSGCPADLWGGQGASTPAGRLTPRPLERSAEPPAASEARARRRCAALGSALPHWAPQGPRVLGLLLSDQRQPHPTPLARLLVHWVHWAHRAEGERGGRNPVHTLGPCALSISF